MIKQKLYFIYLNTLYLITICIFSHISYLRFRGFLLIRTFTFTRKKINYLYNPYFLRCHLITPLNTDFSFADSVVHKCYFPF